MDCKRELSILPRIRPGEAGEMAHLFERGSTGVDGYYPSTGQNRLVEGGGHGRAVLVATGLKEH
jgi:hypothetical protein